MIAKTFNCLDGVSLTDENRSMRGFPRCPLLRPRSFPAFIRGAGAGSRQFWPTGRLTRQEDALTIEIGSPPRLAGYGRLYAVATTPENGRTNLLRGRHVQPALRRLDFGLLRDLQRVIYLDPEVSNGAFQFTMPKQELDGP